MYATTGDSINHPPDRSTKRPRIFKRGAISDCGQGHTYSARARTSHRPDLLSRQERELGHEDNASLEATCSVACCDSRATSTPSSTLASTFAQLFLAAGGPSHRDRGIDGLLAVVNSVRPGRLRGPNADQAVTLRPGLAFDSRNHNCRRVKAGSRRSLTATHNPRRHPRTKYGLRKIDEIVHRFLEPPVGFEPTTPALQERCSGQLS